ILENSPFFLFDLGESQQKKGGEATHTC
ncbi:hypothetical protein B0H50_13130, partial [Hallerella porci]